MREFAGKYCCEIPCMHLNRINIKKCIYTKDKDERQLIYTNCNLCSLKQQQECINNCPTYLLTVKNTQSIPCENCLLLATCKARQIQHSNMYVLDKTVEYCKILRTYLYADQNNVEKQTMLNGNNLCRYRIYLIKRFLTGELNVK